jgi:hypothetical protein
MRQQSTKCQWQIEKPLKFTGRFGYGREKCFHRIEDHVVTLLTVASWRGDLVSIKYISSFL